MAERIVVTDENFGELVLRGVREAVAIKRGELKPARVARYEITARSATVAAPPRYDAEEIRQIRRALRLSQVVFAQMLNVSPSTVRAWERGARSPEGPTLRLLEIAERRPDALLASVDRAA